MFSSLRFRLPAVFLAGVVLAGAIASAIAITLFQDYTRAQTLRELRREAAGLAALYGRDAGDRRAIRTRDLERATNDRLFYLGPNPYPTDPASDLLELPRSAVPKAVLESDGAINFEFTPPRSDRTYLAVATPLRVDGVQLSALVVASPKAELRDEWVTLAERLGLALLAGVLVSGLLGWYLGLRITRPVLRLSRAADEIARGNYEVQLPEARGRDEISHLSRRFDEMALRLREAEEMERNFLMTVSHELRSPLTAIGGHVAALREGVVEDPDLRAASLEVVAEETRRLSRLVGDIIDLAKLDLHRFTVTEQEVDMEQLVERAYAGFTDEARRRAIEFDREVRGGAVIETDGDRVLQIITNLLSNAFRWTPDGGRVELELAAENGTVAVAVEDTGPGIPTEEHERIFRPFYSRGGSGTGLGLAIASELADALGGRLSVSSEEGRGSRFELVLPANRPLHAVPASPG